MTIKQYLKCNNKSKVKLIRVNGRGQTWSSGKHCLPAKIIGRVSYELDAGKEVVDFFLNQ